MQEIEQVPNCNSWHLKMFRPAFHPCRPAFDRRKPELLAADLR
jgi:hypothetical protein